MDGKGKPICLVFDTQKGHGVSWMSGKAEFHGRALKQDEMAMAEPGEKWAPN